MWIFAVLFKLNKKGLTFQVLGGKVQVCVRTHSKRGLCEAELLISITLLNFPALASRLAPGQLFPETGLLFSHVPLNLSSNLRRNSVSRMSLRSSIQVFIDLGVIHLFMVFKSTKEVFPSGKKSRNSDL